MPHVSPATTARIVQINGRRRRPLQARKSDRSAGSAPHRSHDDRAQRAHYRLHSLDEFGIRPQRAREPAILVIDDSPISRQTSLEVTIRVALLVVTACSRPWDWVRVANHLPRDAPRSVIRAITVLDVQDGRAADQDSGADLRRKSRGADAPHSRRAKPRSRGAANARSCCEEAPIVMRGKSCGHHQRARDRGHARQSRGGAAHRSRPRRLAASAAANAAAPPPRLIDRKAATAPLRLASDAERSVRDGRAERCGGTDGEREHGCAQDAARTRGPRPSSRAAVTTRRPAPAAGGSSRTRRTGHARSRRRGQAPSSGEATAAS